MGKSYDKFVILLSVFNGYVRQHIICILSFVPDGFILCLSLPLSLVYYNNLPSVANTRTFNLYRYWENEKVRLAYRPVHMYTLDDEVETIPPKARVY